MLKPAAYAADWVATKRRWNRTSTTPERTALVRLAGEREGWEATNEPAP